MSPPIVGPRIGPSAAGRLTTAISRPSPAPPGTCWMARVAISGIIMPPPMPWTTRNAIRLGASQARLQAIERGEEDGEGDHPQPLAADPGLRPADHRDGHAQREQVAGADPLDGADRHVQVGGQVCSAMLTIVLSKITAIPPAISTRAVTIALARDGLELTCLATMTPR